MTDLVRRDPYEWTANLPAVGDLAGKLASTEFVPAALRGKPAAVAACVLYGAEVGIGPMKSLTSIHVVDGRPAMSAELMRALVMAAGHGIRVQELTATRCILIGTRKGDSDGTTITYSMDDAKRAGVAGKKVWQAYPREMLLARASTMLCRAVFPDVVGGMASIEEAQDGTALEPQADGPTPPAPARRTAKRAGVTTPARPRKAPTVAPAATAAPVDEPPLDDEDEIVDAVVVDDETGEIEDSATPAQLKAIGAAMSAVGWTDRDDRLRLVSRIVARQVHSSKELTKTEAGTVLDTLTFAQETEDPAAVLTSMLEEGQ